MCNGIAQIEKYMLDKIGILSEEISSGTHTFIKLINIELPTEDGETIIGDTILDPTWNLANHRFGAMPNNFCKSYNDIRKQDIKENGEDTKSHKNDEKLSNITLGLEEETLRKIFTSVGLADESGNFPIRKLIEESKKIYEKGLEEEEIIEEQFSLLKEYYPEFAKCQNSTIAILERVLLNDKKLNFNKCVINRVYERDDKTKEVILYVYVDFSKSGKKFYFADKEKGDFVKISQEEFEAKFECYEKDLERQNGTRPWETQKREKEEDLKKTSGKMLGEKGDER